MPCPLFPRNSLSKADPVLGSAAWQCGDQLNCHGSRVGQLCRKDVPQGATPSKGEGWSQDRPARTRKFRGILNMNSIRNLARRVSRDERGITGLETAIILIAFVVVATVFAFIVLTTGLFSAERGKETVFAGLDKARSHLHQTAVFFSAMTSIYAARFFALIVDIIWPKSALTRKAGRKASK